MAMTKSHRRRVTSIVRYCVLSAWALTVWPPDEVTSASCVPLAEMLSVPATPRLIVPPLETLSTMLRL